MALPLTTVRLLTRYMGAEAINLLEDRLITQRTIGKKVILQTQLIIRDSVNTIYK